MKLFKAASLISFLALWGCNGDDPSIEYRDLVAPEALLTSAEARAEGAALFFRHCSLCHGERGDGRGVRRLLSTPPRDLTDPLWRQRSTPEGVFLTIREGVSRTPMAASRIFSVEQTWSLVAHVRSLAEDPS
jgi:mono/diheme cytochrome c family protein